MNPPTLFFPNCLRCDSMKMFQHLYPATFEEESKTRYLVHMMNSHHVILTELPEGIEPVIA